MATRVRRLLWCASVVLSVASGAALADDQAAVPASCARTQSIYDWQPLDDGTIVVRTSPARSYRVTFTSPCRHLKWSVLARVNTRPTSATACLSRGDVILFGRGPRRADDSFEQEERCMVQSVEPYEEPTPPPPPPRSN